jgi:dinuclear metal center YbgI/SA1388 family protein
METSILKQMQLGTTMKTMITNKLDIFFKTLLEINGFEDVSLNGLQVDNDGSDVKKIAFAVDACMETFERTANAGAGLLFVHHGLFWGKPLALTGSHRARLKFLLNNNIALYAAHLPLDHNSTWGNNAVLAEKLGFETCEPFGGYHGRKIGYKCKLKKVLTIEEAVSLISFMDRPPLSVLPFGPKEIRTAAVVSGGAPEFSGEAITDGIDLFVTGEASHTGYHTALEGHLNIIAGGHYSTEVWGVRSIMEQCASQLNIDVEFIDVPTGL